MNNFKKLILLLFLVFSNIVFVFAASDPTILEGLKQSDTIIGGIDIVDNNLSTLDIILYYIKESLTKLLLVTVVGVFLYIGMKLVLARGNPEEFKKALMHFVYVAIGMFVISAAYAAVKLVSGISF